MQTSTTSQIEALHIKYKQLGNNASLIEIHQLAREGALLCDSDSLYFMSRFEPCREQKLYYLLKAAEQKNEHALYDLRKFKSVSFDYETYCQELLQKNAQNTKILIALQFRMLFHGEQKRVEDAMNSIHAMPNDTNYYDDILYLGVQCHAYQVPIRVWCKLHHPSSHASLTMQQSLFLFQEAHRFEHAPANSLVCIAACHLYGCDNLQPNYSQAVAFLQRATFATLDDTKGMAQFLLGECYFHGHGVQQNFKQAISHFVTAAKQHCADAQARLVSCCEQGLGMAVNVTLANKWRLIWQKNFKSSTCNKKNYLP